MNSRYYNLYHNYHLVPSSIIPLTVGIFSFIFLFMLTMVHFHPFHSPTVNYVSVADTSCLWLNLMTNDFYLPIVGSLLILTISLWFEMIVYEGLVFGNHNAKVRNGLRLGFYLFVLSEIMFFFAFFWAYLYNSINPSVDGCGGIWPPYGVSAMSFWGIPLYETSLLLSSWYTVDMASNAFIFRRNHEDAAGWLLITILFGAEFVFTQAEEYCCYMYFIDSGIYGSCFYMLTGFHGFHVVIGIILLLTVYYRLVFGYSSSKNFVLLWAASLYWHFVDAIWVGLVVLVYMWGHF